jgi:hypothetical protein
MTVYGKLVTLPEETAAAREAKDKRQAVLQRIRRQRAQIIKHTLRRYPSLEEMSGKEK